MEPEHIEEEGDPKLAQANKLFQTAVMLIYGKRKSVDKAIKCVQKAITLNDLDYKYWQLLGEAYYQRGSLNPSINCFMKSLALAENQPSAEKRVQADCIYSRLRMSDIRLSVAHLDEASAGYSDIIANDPENVAALIGLSKCELMQSRNNFSSGLVISGHSHCMTALKYALEATKLSPHLCLTWKLASDCCITQFVYGQRGTYVTKIDIDFPGSDNDGLLVNRMICIELAQQFLCKALAIEPFQESGCLWHNLGVSLYLKSTMMKENENERKVLLERSLKCLFKALDNDRDNSQVRNSIGVVTFNLNYLNSAQNFIIKSIQTNMSTSEIQFSNLGYIYLQKGEYRLASTSFSRCQAEEPLYCRSWLGNAILNEQNNIDNLSHLRHCHRLENNYESQVMYATKITSLPMSAEYSKDLVNALDAMKRVINYDRNSLEVINTLGLLYERCNYKNQAGVCFQEANELNHQDSRVIFNRLRQHNAKDSGCAIKPEGFTPDVEFIKAAEKLANSNNREYLLNFIYYLFKNQDYAAVNSRMTKVIEKLGQNDVRNKIGAQVILALAAKANGGDFKSWLFKNIIDSEGVICVESLINLLSLIVFASTTNDQPLMEQVSTDLSKYLIVYLSTRTVQFADFLQSSEGFWTKLTLLSSIFCLKDQGKLVRPLVALYPMIPELWLYLGLSLMHQKKSNVTAIFCIKKASLIGSTDANLCFVCDTLLAILSQQTTKAKNKTPEATTGTPISRALFRHPKYDLLWKFTDENKRSKDQSLVRSLFDLAIDHTLTTVAS